MSYTNSDGAAEHLNASAAHDTGLYDPSIHDNHIVALYETDSRAHAARESLIAAGVPDSAIRLVDTDSTVGLTQHEETGIWGAIKALFVPDENPNAYSHALHHGHAMLLVTPDSTMDRSAVIHALERTEPVDFDAKLEEWRQAGYDYSGHPNPVAGTAIGAASGMANPTDPELDIPPMPVGRREAVGTASRVRSYVVDRPTPPASASPFDEKGIESRAAGAEPVAGSNVATPGATTSGMNAPRT